MNKRVVITGLGVVSSIGIGWEQFWDSLLKGEIRHKRCFIIRYVEPFHAQRRRSKEFRSERIHCGRTFKSVNRSSQMAVASTKLAITDSGIEPNDLCNRNG